MFLDMPKLILLSTVDKQDIVLAPPAGPIGPIYFFSLRPCQNTLYSSLYIVYTFPCECHLTIWNLELVVHLKYTTFTVDAVHRAPMTDAEAPSGEI